VCPPAGLVFLSFTRGRLDFSCWAVENSMGEPITLAVHRCRFVDFTPSAITALAFTPLPLPSLKGKKKTTPGKPLKFGTLAVGHANGNIDLCEWSGAPGQTQSPQAWIVRKVNRMQHRNILSDMSLNALIDLARPISVQSRLTGLRHSPSRQVWTGRCSVMF